MKNKFGSILRKLREEKGLTQEELANFINTTKFTISAWELGKQEPNIDTILATAHFFDVTTDYLLGKEQ